MSAVLGGLRSIMIAALEEQDPIREHEVDESMFLAEAAGPGARQDVFQRLRFAEPREWVPEARIDKVKNLESDFAVRLHPVPEIVPELRLKDCKALRLAWTGHSSGPSPISCRRSSTV